MIPGKIRVRVIEETSTKLAVDVNGARLILDKKNRNDVQYFSNAKGWMPHPNPTSEFVSSVRRSVMRDESEEG